MNAGLLGGIIGGIIGLLGGIIGTYCSIKNTNGPEERSFMIKAAAVFWIVGSIFIILLLLLPSSYKWFLWLPYGFLLPISIIYMNKKLRQIERKTSQNRPTRT
jgi:Ca2+/Na+ antiporter